MVAFGAIAFGWGRRKSDLLATQTMGIAVESARINVDGVLRQAFTLRTLSCTLSASSELKEGQDLLTSMEDRSSQFFDGGANDRLQHVD